VRVGHPHHTAVVRAAEGEGARRVYSVLQQNRGPAAAGGAHTPATAPPLIPPCPPSPASKRTEAHPAPAPEFRLAELVEGEVLAYRPRLRRPPPAWPAGGAALPPSGHRGCCAQCGRPFDGKFAVWDYRDPDTDAMRCGAGAGARRGRRAEGGRGGKGGRRG
jgi:hypothetical protein